MGYLCINCYEEYDKDGLNLESHIGYNYMCPKTDCGGFSVIEVDDLILPVIKLLNKKRYSTAWSCSGHSYKTGGCNTYITFYDDFIPGNMPNGFIIEDEEYYKREYECFSKPEDETTIRKWYDEKLNEYELHTEICKTMVELMEWVMGLENMSI